MPDDLYTLGEVEWRFLPGRVFDMKTSKVRCRGYSVVQDKEVGFVFMRTGEWFALRTNGLRHTEAFATRKDAIDCLLQKQPES